MNRRLKNFFTVVLLSFSTTLVTAADTPPSTPAQRQEAVQKFVDGLHFENGTINVPKASATLKLTPDFRYLDSANAQHVLEDLWGNPPDSQVLGMLVPTDAPLSDPNKSWAVVLTYSDDGHISDADAAKIDYDAMLKEMQQGTRDNNAERIKRGYHAIELVGWAQPPHYDAASNKLYWAKELSFDSAREHTLNYDIRALGRGGYLSMNAIAGMDQLGVVQHAMQNVLAMVEFDSGKRYGDFNASTDKVAAYGIAALVAGAIAAKAGLFAKLLLVIVAAKKFVILGLAAIGGAFSRFFKRKPKP